MSSSPHTLGLGVLGLGEGRSIISAALSSPLWSVASLCDSNEALCLQRRAEFNLASHVTHYDDLLANPQVDVVGIYTPDHLHAEHVLRALKAGKHVICTKPFLDTLERAQEVLAAVKESGKRVFVGQSSRFFESFSRQREHFDSGALGQLFSMEAHYHADHRWFLNKNWAKLASFKWLYGALSHPADFIRWYMPDVDEVMGYSQLSPNGAENGLTNPDTFHFIFKTRTGLTARVSGTYSSPTVPCQRESDMTCVLHCTKGASQADYHELRYSWKIGGQSVIETFENREDYYFRFGGRTHHAGEYQNYIDHFARCLAEGATARPDVEEGIVTVALLQAMERSCVEGRPIKLCEVLSEHGLESLLKP